MRNDPILICGCPGTGTSLLSKMLRHCGLFLGADAGSLHARKFHESAAFRQANNTLLQWTISFPHAPKGIEQFQSHVKRLKRHSRVVHRLIRLDPILNEFWQDEDRARIWGWKDPRNSANLPFWLDVFPELRVVVIERKWSNRLRDEIAKSDSGRWFRQQSDAKIRTAYTRLEDVPPDQVYRVDFDNLREDPAEIQRLVSQLGLDDAQVQDFDQFCQTVGMDSRDEPR